MNTGLATDNNINLTFKHLLFIATGTSIIALILYFLLPLWGFLGLVVAIAGAINILCVALAGLHFVQSKQ